MFMDKVIAAYGVDMTDKGESKDDIREKFVDFVTVSNYREVYDIMKKIDLEMNGRLTFDWPKKLKAKYDKLYEEDCYLIRHLQWEARKNGEPSGIKSDSVFDDNGEAIFIPMDIEGWGQDRDIIFDKKTGKRYI